MTTVRTSCAGAVVLAALLGGCAQSPGGHMTDRQAAAPAPATHVADKAPSVGGTGRLRMAALALDDRTLGTIRGGFDLAPGLVVSFGFEQATYLNHDLLQTIVIPTMTVAPDLARSVAGGAAGGNLASTPGSPTPVTMSTPAGSGANTLINVNGTSVSTARTSANAGLTSIVSSLGSNGLTSLIQNRANGQLIQQVTTMNIAVSGLSQLLTRSDAANAASRLAAVSAYLH